MSELLNVLNDFIHSHPNVKHNPSRENLINESIINKEAIISKTGCLATWTPADSTGRSPEDTVIVKRAESQDNIDWTSKYNIPVTEETFDMFFQDALNFMKQKEKLYVLDRSIGADNKYSLPLQIITERALGGVFADNMFREIPERIKESCFYNTPFTLLALPFHKLSTDNYRNKLRKLPDGRTSNMIIAMDLDRRIAIIIGSSYLGTMKKTIFTVMNYYLPFENILPLHCSANEGQNGDSVVMLGLSGTGKTTLSADPERKLLGDDEHSWSEKGISNFENGCYAKMLDITEKKEPEIWNAIMHEDDYLNHGAIIENALIYPNGEFDFTDPRLSQNSRASYPLKFLKNIKPSSIAGPPEALIFLTADAYGVLPPISKLDPYQARLWFLMGYTSKLAGTERGIIQPEATFSRFFGAPFMPCKPEVYSQMLGEKLDKYNTKVFLINTGWSGGKYGVGNRMNLLHTRSMLNAAITGQLDNVEYIYDEIFHVNIPKTCPNVPAEILNPINTWENKTDFTITAKKLARKFKRHFNKSFKKQNIDKRVKASCPGFIPK